MATSSNPRRALSRLPLIGSFSPVSFPFFVGSFFALYVSWIFLSLGTAIIRRDHQLTHEGREVQATILRFEQGPSNQRPGSGSPLLSSGGSRSSVIYYRFIDARGHAYVGNEILSRKSRPKPLWPGDTITVRYLPSDPTISAFESDVVAGYLFTGGSLLGFGMSIAAFVVAMRLRRQPGLLGARQA